MDASRTRTVEYPFNHSTYYTRNDDDPYTSELPVRNAEYLIHYTDEYFQPMNSEEDVLQEHLMTHRQYGRDSSYLNPIFKNKGVRGGYLTRFLKVRTLHIESNLTKFYVQKMRRNLQRAYWKMSDRLSRRK